MDLKATSATVLAVKLQERRRRSGASNIGIEDAQELAEASHHFQADVLPSELPKPTCPTTRKDEVYGREGNTALFYDLESHAVKMSSVYMSFSTLMDKLLVADLSDLEKARILFHWITAQNLNSINFPHDLMEDTPLGYLKAIKENEKSYAELFMRLCSAAGLYGKVIEGFIKGVGYCPDHKFKLDTDAFRGSWNAVLIDGEWRLIDTHWGARHVTEEEDADEAAWRTEYEYEEHYFLTDPDELINTHFPDEPEWQLLPTPVTLRQFERFPKQWALFFKLQLSHANHQSGLIESDDCGYVEVKLKVPPLARDDAKFNAELLLRHSPTRYSNVAHLQQYIFHYSTTSEEVFEIFLPRPERYLLKVFGLSTKFSLDNHFTNLCTYQINCARVKESNRLLKPPFPLIDSSYGPNPRMREIGVKPVTHAGPFAECDERGEVAIVMLAKRNPDDFSFSRELRDTDSVMYNGHVIHTIVDAEMESRLILYVRAPRNGNFSLTLYSSAHATDDEVLKAFCHYLICSRKLSEDAATDPYPEVKGGRLGPVQPCYNDLEISIHSYSPSSCEGAHWLKSSALGEYSITFRHNHPLLWSASLMSSSAAYDDFVMLRTDGNFSTVAVRTPTNIVDRMVLLVKVYAAPLGQFEQVPAVFIAFVTCRKSKQTLYPWPQSPTRMWGPVWEKYNDLSITSVRFSTPASTSASPEHEEKLRSPYRKYAGSGDYHMELEHKRPFQIKPKLIGLNEYGARPVDRDAYAIVCKATLTSSTLRLRFPDTGYYRLILFGEAQEDQSGQLAPFYYALFHVKKPAARKSQFPMQFALWTTSRIELHSPLNHVLKRGEKILFKLTLGSFSKRASGQYDVRPYPNVMLLVNEATPLESTLNAAQSPCEYEWIYKPAERDTKIGIVIQEDASQQSLSYILLFEVDD